MFELAVEFSSDVVEEAEAPDEASSIGEEDRAGGETSLVARGKTGMVGEAGTKVWTAITTAAVERVETASTLAPREVLAARGEIPCKTCEAGAAKATAGGGGTARRSVSGISSSSVEGGGELAKRGSASPALSKRREASTGEGETAGRSVSGIFSSIEGGGKPAGRENVAAGASSSASSAGGGSPESVRMGTEEYPALRMICWATSGLQQRIVSSTRALV